MRKKNENGAIMYRNYSTLRDEKGMNDYQMSKETGFSTAFFSNWKNRGWQPSGDKIVAIARVLNRPLEDFYEGVVM